jgi:twitching motility protein PilT
VTKLIRDAQLDELVRELNETDARPSSEQQAGEEPGIVPADNALEALLIDAVQRRASDVHLIAGAPPMFRVAGVLTPAGPAALSSNELHTMLTGLLGGMVERLRTDGAVDFSLRLSRPAGEDDRRALRFRVNVHRQRGSLAAAIRALPSEVPTLRDLNLPPLLADLVKPNRGLVLVCGPTGSGKTTTLASLVAEVNRTQSRHIITIEDPIEYEHRNMKSVIEQIEIGRDAPSFHAALRSALRQDPDVILVGEMRDLETVSTALTAAETGHLILSTLHTSDAMQAIHRIIDVFPSTQQTQIRQQLALSLNAILVQQLIPRPDGGGRSVAVELLLSNTAVRNHIRSDKLQNLPTEITLGKRAGMISFEDSLAALVQQGLLSSEEAKLRSRTE